jgi:SAM-dependent methyltransferase
MSIAIKSLLKRPTKSATTDSSGEEPGIGLRSLIKQWSSGIDHELSFWRQWLSTRGANWPEDFKSRMALNRAFPDDILKASGAKMPERPLIVDVGSGPVSPAPATVDGRRAKLIPCDPLAPFYDVLLNECGVEPPVRTQFAFAEDLSSFFDHDSVDIVFCANALDHSFEPLRGIEEMLAVVKSSGLVHLSHRINEAESEAYAGFHQWNFNEEAGRFIIWNRSERIDVNDALDGVATLKVTTANGWIRVLIVKDGDANRLRQRVAERRRERIQILLEELLLLATKSSRLSYTV